MEPLLFAGALVLFYAGVYFLNHKTPVPEGCEDLTQSCNGCAIASCALHPNQRQEGSVV